ncbi:MAG: phosphate acyltransferase, partial [Planctomycetota bacterium]
MNKDHRMSLLEKLEEQACQRCPVIAYPEPEDDRIIEASAEIARRGIARPILACPEDFNPKEVPSGVEVVSMGDPEKTEKYVAAYAERRALDLAKTLVRAATKAALAEGIEEAVSDEDETAGDVAGWAARIAGAVLERADTRCWHLLPARLEVHRVRLPAGSHRIEALYAEPVLEAADK